MRVLLDTSSFLWFISGNELLSPTARQLISDSDNQLFLSTASLWEIAIKVSVGKLTLTQPFAKLFPGQLLANDVVLLPISLDHAARIIDLPFHHRDPFDRMLIAQAMVEDLPLISPDSILARYPIKLIW